MYPGRALLRYSHLIAWVVLLAGAPTGCPQRALAEPTLRVRAQVAIQLHVVAKAAALYVEGTLQDDLGARLANEHVTATFHGGSAALQGRSRDLRTDSRGQFSLPASCTACDVTVEFAGDSYYERASVTQPVVLDRPALTLEVIEPAQLAVSLNETRVDLVVRASSTAPVDAIPITLENELARRIGQGKTGPDGVLRLRVDSSALGPYGLGEIVARAEASSAHVAARASKAILRTLATQTQLTASYAAKQRLLHISVELKTQSGPISQRAVGVFIDREHFTTLVTDEHGLASGQFNLAEDALTADEHKVSANFQSDIPGLLSSQSAPVALRFAPPPRPSIGWLLAPVLASIVFVVWSARRAPAHAKRAETVEPAGPEVRLGAESRGRAAPQFTISGRVEDVDSGQPLDAGIEIVSQGQLVHVLQATSDGAFASGALPAGSYQVRVVAPGYAPLAFALALPHYGSASDMQIAARSLRVLALDTYSRFATRVLPEARTRGKTVRETLTAAVGCGKGIPAVNDLAGATERIAYARAIPYEGDLHDLQRSAAAALHELGESASGPSDPDLGW